MYHRHRTLGEEGRVILTWIPAPLPLLLADSCLLSLGLRGEWEWRTQQQWNRVDIQDAWIIILNVQLMKLLLSKLILLFISTSTTVAAVSL